MRASRKPVFISFAVVAIVLSLSYGVGYPQKGGKAVKPCNNNGVCEWGETDPWNSNQWCSDCSMYKTYNHLTIGASQFVADGIVDLPFSTGKVFQFKPQTTSLQLPPFVDSWASNSLGSSYVSVNIGDVDNDTFKEIIAVASYKTGVLGNGKNAINQWEHRLFVFENGASGAPSYVSAYFGKGSGVIREVEIANIDSTPENELIMLIGGRVLITRLSHSDSLYVLNNPETIATHDFVPMSISAGDADSDGRNEILVPLQGNGGASVAVWKYHATTGWTKTLTEPVTEFNPNVATPGWILLDVAKVRDVDGDGYGEIIAGGNNNRLMIWKYATGAYEKIFVSEDLGYFTPGVDAGDIDGDGKTEIVVGTSNSSGALFVFKFVSNLNGSTYDIVGPYISGGKTVSAIGDIDNDGREEVVCRGGGVTVFKWDAEGGLAPVFNCAYGGGSTIG